MVSPSAKRRAVQWLEDEGWGGKAPSCRALGLARSGAYYLPSESVASRRVRKEIGKRYVECLIDSRDPGAS